MKVSFLLRRDNGLAFECVSVGLRTQQHHLNLIDARKEMYAALTVYLESEGTNYVQGHFHNAYAVNCPEGRSTQPIDLWYCKLSEAACPLQAKVFLDSREAFIAGCTAPTSRKDDIFRIIKEGQYKGFHHVPGRYLCSTCTHKNPYYYPFEMTLLPPLLGVNDETSRKALKRTLLNSHLPLNLTYCRLCPKCALKFSTTINPNLAPYLEIITLDFYPR